jgi:hypothetical protein
MRRMEFKILNLGHVNRICSLCNVSDLFQDESWGRQQHKGSNLRGGTRHKFVLHRANPITCNTFLSFSFKQVTLRTPGQGNEFTASETITSDCTH